MATLFPLAQRGKRLTNTEVDHHPCVEKAFPTCMNGGDGGSSFNPQTPPDPLRGQERLRDLIGPWSGTYGMGYGAVQPL